MSTWDERHGAELKARTDRIDEGNRARNLSLEAGAKARNDEITRRLAERAQGVPQSQSASGDTRTRFIFPSNTPPPGEEGNGLPDGVIWRQFTGCNSGVPFTYWAPTWDSNPS